MGLLFSNCHPPICWEPSSMGHKCPAFNDGKGTSPINVHYKTQRLAAVGSIFPSIHMLNVKIMKTVQLLTILKHESRHKHPASPSSSFNLIITHGLVTLWQRLHITHPAGATGCWLTLLKSKTNKAKWCFQGFCRGKTSPTCPIAWF